MADLPAASKLRAFAAQRLLAGDPLPALNALGVDAAPAARALRGIALAQLQEFAAARAELAAAVTAFARSKDVPAEARALAAAGEVAAAQRDFAAADRLLVRAAKLLARSSEPRNAAWSLAVHARLRALAGDAAAALRLLARAERALPGDADGNLLAALALARADLALGRGDAAAAALALQQAEARLDRSIAPALAGELGAAAAAVREHHFVAIAAGRSVGLDALELAAIRSGRSRRLSDCLGAPRWFAVDAIAMRAGFGGGTAVPLRRRPVLFSLLHCLAAAWPHALGWRQLARTVFGLELDDDSLRLRAKVEIERLRRLLPARARLVAAHNAWRLQLPRGTAVVLLTMRNGLSAGPLPQLLQALLADGAPWSIDALATASGCSRSSVLRALRGLGDRVRALGAARARRYMTAEPRGIASQMLLVGVLDDARRSHT